MNAAQRVRAVRRSLLCWDCVANAKFMGPYGNRKCPGGAFSRKAVTGLSGQAINEERKSRRSVRQYDLLLRC